MNANKLFERSSKNVDIPYKIQAIVRTFPLIFKAVG